MNHKLPESLVQPGQFTVKGKITITVNFHLCYLEQTHHPEQPEITPHQKFSPVTLEAAHMAAGFSQINIQGRDICKLYVMHTNVYMW